MNRRANVLVTGASGQIGEELVAALRKVNNKVYPSDIRIPDEPPENFLELDVLDKARMREIVQEYEIEEIFHLAAILSAKGEENPMLAWRVNLESVLTVLELAAEFKLFKVFIPSSIAVFGLGTPKIKTPQHTVTAPDTVYGITKLAGERWCNYYHYKKGVDIRSLRYPGLIGYKTLPGGGTTDYAVDIFHKALETGHYDCFIGEDVALPMMYMPDAIRATIELLQAPPEKLQVRSAYNLSGMSFTPREIAAAIKKHIPDFTISYKPDFRNKIAKTWPSSIDDTHARNDWNWQPEYDLDKMTEDMLKHLRENLK